MNTGIVHFKSGGRPICGNERAFVATADRDSFDADPKKCKRCAAKLKKRDSRAKNPRRHKPTKRSTSKPGRAKRSAGRATKRARRNPMPTIAAKYRGIDYGSPEFSAMTRQAVARLGGGKWKFSDGSVLSMKPKRATKKRAAKNPAPRKLTAGKSISIKGKTSARIISRGGRKFLELR